MGNDQNQTARAVLSNDGLCMLDDGEADPVRLWAEIHRLRAAVQGPDGFATWQEAATAERVRRVQAERELAELRYRLAEPPSWPAMTVACDAQRGGQRHFGDRDE